MTRDFVIFGGKDKPLESNILGAGELKIAARRKHTCPLFLQSLYNNEMVEKHHLMAKKDFQKSYAFYSKK